MSGLQDVAQELEVDDLDLKIEDFWVPMPARFTSPEAALAWARAVAEEAREVALWTYRRGLRSAQRGAAGGAPEPDPAIDERFHDWLTAWHARRHRKGAEAARTARQARAATLKEAVLEQHDQLRRAGVPERQMAGRIAQRLSCSTRTVRRHLRGQG